MLRIMIDPGGMIRGLRKNGILVPVFARTVTIREATNNTVPAVTAAQPNISMPATLAIEQIAIGPLLQVGDSGRMQKTSLTALSRELLENALRSSSGRSSRTVFGGHEHVLRQTVITLAAGQTLAEHVSPG